ncbi:MAG: GNAT family N-acetyltransferase [Chromatiales bacterium]|jgi:GNAT superfamily N-acetyltransferase|nr:GNAT family N-acetyltransferase [Chromatiales bacterium]
MTALIRDATADDLATIVQFNCSMALETEGKELDQRAVALGVSAMLDNANLGHYFVAQARGDASHWQQGETLGCTMVTYEWSDWRAGAFWWIQSVYITPDARRQGVFSRLYGHIRGAALAANACGLRLYVERDNERAQATYAQLGMHETPYRLLEEEFTP